MTEQVIVVINSLSLVLFVLSFLLIVVMMAGRGLDVDTGFLLALLAAGLAFISFTNIMEHQGIAAWWDYYEDYVEMLLPFFFIIFLNSVRLHEDIRRRGEHLRQQNAMLEERRELLKEVHHRVKNNLQLILSLMRLQRRDLASDERLNHQMLLTENRILSMAAVHDLIYRVEEHASIPAGDLVRNIASQLFQNDVEGRNIRVDPVYDIDDSMVVRLEVAIPMGLLVNELLTNALRQIGSGMAENKLDISLFGDGDLVVIRLSHGECGPSGRGGSDEECFGIQLIRSIVSQIKGTMETYTGRETVTTVRFPR